MAQAQAAKADKPKNTQQAAPADDAPEGFVQAGRPDIDGWFKAEKGATVHGVCVDRMRVEGMNHTPDYPQYDDIVLVKLKKPITASLKGDETKDLQPGDVLAVRCSHALKNLLLYVAHQGEVWFKVQGKEGIGKGRHVWKIDFRANPRAKKAKPPPIFDAATIAAEDAGDDIPF